MCSGGTTLKNIWSRLSSYCFILDLDSTQPLPEEQLKPLVIVRRSCHVNCAFGDMLTFRQVSGSDSLIQDLLGGNCLAYSRPIRIVIMWDWLKGWTGDGHCNTGVETWWWFTSHTDRTVKFHGWNNPLSYSPLNQEWTCLHKSEAKHPRGFSPRNL